MPSTFTRCTALMSALRCAEETISAARSSVPGVHASHGMERTHIEALDATVSLILAYLRTLCA